MRIFTRALVIGAVLVTGLSSRSIFAQEQQQPSATGAQIPSARIQAQHTRNPQRQAKRMAKKLALTPDQASQLEPILAQRQQQLESARADATLAQKDKRAKLRSINQDSDSKIESILTDAQKQQYEQMKQNHKASKQQQSGAPTNS